MAAVLAVHCRQKLEHRSFLAAAELRHEDIGGDVNVGGARAAADAGLDCVGIAWPWEGDWLAAAIVCH